MQRRPPYVLSLAFAAGVALFAGPAAAQDWSRFRGPNGSGVSTAVDLPLDFTEQSRAWKVAIPPSHSSPIVVGETVYVAATTPEELLVFALDAKSGKTLWKHALARGQVREIYESNDFACPTPTSDGENLYVFFPEHGLFSFDREGKERWRKALGPFHNFYGMASSPILAGDALIQLCEQQRDSYLLAVDRATGETRWKTARTESIDAWTTPILEAREGAAGRVIVHGSWFVAAYDLRDGKEAWRVPSLSYGPVCSPIATKDRVYACAPFQAEQPFPPFDAIAKQFDADKDGAIAKAEMGTSAWGKHFGWVDADESGQITRKEWDTCVDAMANKDHGLVAIDLAPKAESGSESSGPKEIWRHKRSLPSISTPLCFEGVIYFVKDGGIFTALDEQSGEVKKSERLPEGTGEYYASPIAADGKIYLARNDGVVSVLRAGADWAVLSTSDLGEELRGTPAISNGAIFIRTVSGVSCYRR